MSNRKTITLSEYLGSTAQKLESIGVLNTNLGIDTKLFIDPKLVVISNVPELKEAKKKIEGYFDQLLAINNQSSKTERLRQKALSMIAVKEPTGLFIGYGNSRDSGTAIPISVAKQSLISLNEMLSVGFEDIKVMELLGLFVPGFGSDSVSDLIAHIIYEDLCRYTQRVCLENKFKVHEWSVGSSKFKMPKHPFKNKQILFVPLEIISELPLAASWEEIAAAAARNEQVRADFNSIIGDDLKKFIAGVKKDPRFLLQSIEKMQTLVKTYTEAIVTPYDILTDPRGYLRVNSFFDEISGTLSSKVFRARDITQVHSFIINSIVPQYKRYIEQIGASKLLYKRIGTTLQKVDPKKPLHEEVAQIIFHGMADQLCQKANIMITRESTTAPGSVDFALGTGYKDKVIVEIKKSTNNNLIDGYLNQVERYKIAEAAISSIYIVVIVRKSNIENKESQLNQLKKIHESKLKKDETVPDLVVIDGLIYSSASKPSLSVAA